jgi:hypothetical protein
MDATHPPAELRRSLDELAATAERYGLTVHREGHGEDYLAVDAREFAFLTGRYGPDGRTRSVHIYGEGIDEEMLALWFSMLARSIASGRAAA